MIQCFGLGLAVKRDKKTMAKQISKRVQLTLYLIHQRICFKNFSFGFWSSLESLQGEVRAILMGLLWNISNLCRIEVIPLDCDGKITRFNLFELL